MTRQPRAWFDAKNVLKFRGDVPFDEVRELTDLMTAAFNAGLKSGYRQGITRGQSARLEPADSEDRSVRGRTLG